jgi:hypothetical protein
MAESQLPVRTFLRLGRAAGMTVFQVVFLAVVDLVAVAGSFPAGAFPGGAFPAVLEGIVCQSVQAEKEVRRKMFWVAMYALAKESNERAKVGNRNGRWSGSFGDRLTLGRVKFRILRVPSPVL